MSRKKAKTSSPSQPKAGLAERANLLVKLVTEGQAKRARNLLKQEPELAEANFYVACAVGNVAFVRKALRQDPKLAVTPGGLQKAAPLLYACFSGFLRLDSKLASGIVAVVRQLLARGADPNSIFVLGQGAHACRLSALYAVAGRANHAGLTRLLMEAGADPNDNESLYHSAEFKDLACTRLLLKHGAKIPGSNAVHRKLDFDDLPGLRLFLDHCADANLAGPGDNTLLHWAISNERSVKFLKLLADRGADLRARNCEGLTPFQQASRLGHEEAVRFLTQRGAVDELNPNEQFIAACARGDGRVVKAILKRSPKIMQSLQAPDRGLIAAMAWRGKTKAVRVMLEAGFDIAATGKGGDTPLHTAAWKGHLATVQALLKAGAPLEVKDTQYNATPTGWALHGVVNARDSEGKPFTKGADYAGILAALLKAGAKVSEDNVSNLKDELPPKVRQVLKRAGLMD